MLVKQHLITILEHLLDKIKEQKLLGHKIYMSHLYAMKWLIAGAEEIQIFYLYSM